VYLDVALLHKITLQCGHMGSIFECGMLMNDKLHVIFALFIGSKKSLMTQRPKEDTLWKFEIYVHQMTILKGYYIIVQPIFFITLLLSIFNIYILKSSYINYNILYEIITYFNWLFKQNVPYF
jgi:hypothetical protein